jgi:hypothetical protein
MKQQQQKQSIISVEFFHDDPNTPWKPLPEHNLEQSPCYPIIGVSAYLETIEHHCKYTDPEAHKSEISKSLLKEEHLS